MGVIGSTIGGTLGIGASIFGGINASKAMKKIKENLKEREAENQDWYDRRYNEDATQRADAQRMLTMMNDNIRQRNQQAAGSQAVMGGTDESTALSKASNNQALADAAATIAVNGDKRKDNIESTYMTNKSNLEDQLNNLEQSRATAISQAVQGVADAGASMSSVL